MLDFEDRLLYSRQEAAKLFGVSTRTVDRMIDDGELAVARSKHLDTRITRESILAAATGKQAA